jgi:hypothetical protein
MELFHDFMVVRNQEKRFKEHMGGARHESVEDAVSPAQE